MLQRIALLTVVIGIFAWAVLASHDTSPKARQPLPIPAMEFNDVKELAPGVFFRYASISATDPSIFGGSNHVWIVFKDFVVVIDANFPKEAADVVADIKKTTKKPIKYVLDTHHHGDHAYGNAVWAKEGAQIIASKPAARLLKTTGPQAWEEAAKTRQDIRDSELKQVDISFEDKYEIKDETQHVIFYNLGHSHTIGDAVAYLPQHKILCTGDACVNGAFNFMGHSNSAEWIKCLDAMAKWDIDIICPGHGKPARKDLLEKEKRYFRELREAVAKGIAAKKTVEEITQELDFPWYKEWTGVGVVETEMNKNNVKHVYEELLGKIDHSRLGGGPAPLNWSRGRVTTVAGR